MHCVDVQAIVEENAALIAGEVNLMWSFYTDADSNLTWPVYGQRFGAEPLTFPMDLKIQGGDYLVSAECVDLWPDPVDPTQNQITSIDIVMWIEGRTLQVGQSMVVDLIAEAVSAQSIHQIQSITHNTDLCMKKLNSM